MRDTQRGKVYRAEQSCPSWQLRRHTSLVETWAYCERIERDRWFRRHYGLRRFRLNDGRGRRRGAADTSGWITLPKHARHPMYILHEVAHVVGPRHCLHGWEFARAYLTLVRHFIGTQAYVELRAAFKANRVRYNPKRQMSAFTVAALRDRLEQRREAAGPPHE